jgi:hypothetical protein
MITQTAAQASATYTCSHARSRPRLQGVRNLGLTSWILRASSWTSRRRCAPG